MGCYSTVIPEGFMIISINSIHFSVRNRKENDPEAAGLVFDWLGRKLKEAREEGLRAILTYHLPHGVFLTPIGVEKYWVHAHEELLRVLLNEYAGIISGIYTGHMHLSTFNVTSHQSKEGKEFRAGVLVNRAVSPIFENNPGFALYYYVDSAQHPTYFEEFTFPLKSTYNRTDPPQTFWTLLYNSRRDLGMQDLSAEGIGRFVGSVESDLRKHLNYMVLRLGVDLRNCAGVETVARKVCKEDTVDLPSYHMCVDSLIEHVKDKYK